MTAVILLLNMASLKAVTLSPSDKLSFTSQQMTIEQVFDEISTQLKCDVFYSENQLDAQKLIRLPRLQMTLDETLQFVLADKYSYTIEKNAIVIASRPTVSSKKVSGTVKDEKGRLNSSEIQNQLSPVTAYHLGWVNYIEEIDVFPQLKR